MLHRHPRTHPNRQRTRIKLDTRQTLTISADDENICVFAGSMVVSRVERCVRVVVLVRFAV